MPRMPRDNPPKIICLCGSARFIEEFAEENARLTLEGYIVLSIGLSKQHVQSYSQDTSQEEVEADLDWLHKRKIDLADEVFIVNVGGYIGDSTRSEIDYATRHKKPITYLEPIT